MYASLEGKRGKLVLGYDTGCTKCRELVGRIEERVGGKLEVRSLRDPQVESWRQQALGEDAPWAPTLFRIEDTGRMRAWTGTRMAVGLIHALGPVSSWRVMQALGQVGEQRAAVAAAGGSSLAGMAAAGMSRGQFLKGLGGAAVALGALSGAAFPAQAATRDGIDVDGLTEALSEIEQIPSSVIKKGEKATKEWLRRRLNVDDRAGTRQSRGLVGCISAVGVAIIGNALPYLKIVKIRAAIRAAGGTRTFVSMFLSTYRWARSRGYSRYFAIRLGIRRAARASGPEAQQALLELFYLGQVYSACFE